MPRKNFMVTALYDAIKTSYKFNIMDTYNKTQNFPESFFTLNKTYAKYEENSMSTAKIPGVQTLRLQCKFCDYTCVYMPLGASFFDNVLLVEFMYTPVYICHWGHPTDCLLRSWCVGVDLTVLWHLLRLFLPRSGMIELSLREACGKTLRHIAIKSDHAASETGPLGQLFTPT